MSPETWESKTTNMTVKSMLLRTVGALGAAAVITVGLMALPDPLFAYSAGTGQVTIASDRPISAEGGDRLIRRCEQLLARSPLKAEGRPYRLYVANESWRNRLFFLPVPGAGGVVYYALGRHAFLSGADFEAGRLTKRGQPIGPPRTLAYYCAHEVTHIVIGDQIGLAALLRLPDWVGEGLPDYVAMEERESFEQLDTALGDRPVDIEMMRAHGVYPHYRLLVTYFIEKQGWSAERLLQTRLTYAEAVELMRRSNAR